MPPAQGMKIIAVGTRSARWQASCPAPDTICMASHPTVAAARRTASMQPASKRSGDWCQISSSPRCSPAAEQIAAASASRADRMEESLSSSGCRRSTVRLTCPGMVLREFGWTSSWPTVAHAPGRCSRPMRLTASTMRAAPSSASRRVRIGVGPAWASWPVTARSNQRCPCAPVTTPMAFPSCSRTGPCSMWSSKYAAISSTDTRSAPR